jgi:hypothetical protein
MRVDLLLQPFTEEGRVGAALDQCADSASALWLITAWAQESGLQHLRGTIEGIHGRSGRAEAILGVDQGIATYEGLKLALETFDDVYLFHDGGRSFHPKLYAIENDDTTRLIIGSSNVTEGGLFNNFEVSVAIDLDRRDEDDEKFRDEARDYFKRFLKKEMPVRHLDANLAEKLRNEGVVTTSAQRVQAQRAGYKQSQPALQRIFGKKVSGLPSAPHVARKPGRTSTRSTGGISGGTVPPVTAVPPTTTRLRASPVAMSWWRVLSASDAMKKGGDSHQRKDVILNKGPHPIDQTVFFRQHFFAGAAWTQRLMRSYQGRPKRTKEIATIPFDVFISGRHLGNYDLTVDHANSRIAGQGNSPTWLNWSDLGTEIGKNDYTGWYLLLERLANNTFQLKIRKTKPRRALIPPAARV